MVSGRPDSAGRSGPSAGAWSVPPGSRGAQRLVSSYGPRQPSPLSLSFSRIFLALDQTRPGYVPIGDVGSRFCPATAAGLRQLHVTRGPGVAAGASVLTLARIQARPAAPDPEHQRTDCCRFVRIPRGARGSFAKP